MHIGRTDKSVWFSLDFCPDAELVVVVRHFVDDFCKRILDMDHRGLLQVAIHELMENGVKHAHDGRVNMHVEVERREAFVTVRLRTRNMATEEDLQAVRDLFQQRSEAASAEEFYHGMMLKPGPGGLGLARIMAETEMHLSLQVEDGLVIISGNVDFPIEDKNP